MEICPKCGLPNQACVCEQIVKSSQKIQVKTDKKKYGKTVTIITGFEGVDVKKTAKALKNELACGGTFEGNTIELQGLTKNQSQAKHTQKKRKMENKEKKLGKGKSQAIAMENGKDCKDRKCHVHGNLKVRGRTFEGIVTKKFSKRIVIEFERNLYIRKYERYAKYKVKIHARLPDCMSGMIHVGDYVRVRECRPLSKIIHFTVTDKINSGEKK